MKRTRFTGAHLCGPSRRYKDPHRGREHDRWRPPKPNAPQ